MSYGAFNDLEGHEEEGISLIDPTTEVNVNHRQSWVKRALYGAALVACVVLGSFAMTAGSSSTNNKSVQHPTLDLGAYKNANNMRSKSSSMMQNNKGKFVALNRMIYI